MAMVKFLLDTSVLIEAIRIQKFSAEEFLRAKYKDGICISPITVAELFSGQSSRDKEVENFLKYLIDGFKQLEMDQETAILAGQLRCFYKIAIADAFIAASAIQTGARLVSHNQKDFSKVPNLKIIKPK